MSFRTLHQFTITVDKDVKETTTRTDNGKEITETTTRKQPVQVTLLLKEPSRREKQDVSLWRSISYSEGINIGLLPRLTMIQKLSRDPLSPMGGDDQNLAAMQARMHELANDHIRVNAQSGAPTEETEARKQRISNEWEALRKKVTDIETSYQSVFANTAEQYADNKALTWLTLFLTYIKTGPDRHEPLFKGTDFKAKEDSLGDMEDASDPIYLAAVEKLSTCFMLYYLGHASKPEDFARWEERWAKEMEATKRLKEEAEKATLPDGGETVVAETPSAAPSPASEPAPVEATS